MKRFVVPPDWPSPPRRSWVPPKTWRPDPSWPAAPEGWQFWVDGKGEPVRGPFGRYAGHSHRTLFAGVGAMVLVLGVVFWALSAVGLFGGNGDEAAHVAAGSSPTPTPSASRTPVVPTPVPTTAPSTRKTSATPSKTPPRPSVTRSSEHRQEQVKPTTTPKTTKATPKPPRATTSRPPTRDEILRKYCADRGWPPEWCEPDNWQDPSADPTP